MNKKQQDELLEKIQDGDKEAKKELLNFMSFYIAKVALKYQNETRLSIEKLKEAGLQGAEQAINNWPLRKERQYRFSVHALWFIRQAIGVLLSLWRETSLQSVF